MRIEIAEVPVEIRCEFEENRRFLREYRSDKEPVLTIEPSEEDILAMQRELDAMTGCHTEYSALFLENNTIHALLAEKLLDFDVLLFHGSALCMDGKAYLFAAKSGTGKSTHARLWREEFGDRVWMINDDKPLLRVQKEEIMVYGSPWCGKHHLGRNACAPLQAVAFLERDQVNHIEPLERREVFRLLMTNAYKPSKAASLQKVMNLETVMLERTAFYRLGCTMESEAARTAYRCMSRDS